MEREWSGHLRAARTARNGDFGRTTRARAPVARLGPELVALQRLAGNQTVIALLQRAADADAGAPTSTAETSDPAVDALDLQSKVKGVANKLKKAYPSISFTSGRRSDVSDQASAMAGNVVQNRQWITETYADKSLSNELQDWLDKNPKATTKEDIAAGLTQTMNSWDDKKKGRLSAHFTGEAFDVQPQSEKADEIKAEAKKLAEADGGKFLEKEGGLVRWHAQVRE